MERDDILSRFTLDDKAEITSTEEEIGRGSYGKVFKVNYYGTLCAAKEIHSILLENVSRQELERTKSTYLRECRQCCALRHPNIVQFLGLYYPPSTSQSGGGIKLPVIVMELMEESLKSYVESAERNNTIIPYLSKLSILQDVVQGLRYLHHQNPPVVHRDLSPNNILLTAHQVAKISDLGVAKAVKLDSIHSMTKAPGTSNFMPPEALVESSKYGASLDVFSYGGVALFVISQEWPVLLPVKRFDESLNRLTFLTEVERRQKYVDKMKENAREIKSLIISCLDENPKMRPATAKVLENIKELKRKCQSKEKQNQKEQLRQQQPLTSSHMQALHPQLQSDPVNFISSDPLNPTQSEKLLHDCTPVSKAVCKSDKCASEAVEGCDGYCLTCYARYHPPTHDQVRQIHCMIITKLTSQLQWLCFCVIMSVTDGC